MPVLLVNPLFFLRVVCKLQSVMKFECDVTMPLTTVEVGKLEIVNINLNK